MHVVLVNVKALAGNINFIRITIVYSSDAFLRGLYLARILSNLFFSSKNNFHSMFTFHLRYSLCVYTVSRDASNAKLCNRRGIFRRSKRDVPIFAISHAI